MKQTKTYRNKNKKAIRAVNRLAGKLTDTMAACCVQHVARLARAPVAALGVQALGILADPRHRTLVNICGVSTGHSLTSPSSEQEGLASFESLRCFPCGWDTQDMSPRSEFHNGHDKIVPLADFADRGGGGGLKCINSESINWVSLLYIAKHCAPQLFKWISHVHQQTGGKTMQYLRIW